MRRLVPIALAALLLAGCASTPDEPDATREPATAPDGCVEISQGAIDALQGGLDKAGAGYTIDTVGGIQNEEAWYVSAHVLGDPDATATWMTVNDPSVDGENAFVSVTELASLVSYWAYPGDLSGSDPVNAAEDCLP